MATTDTLDEMARVLRNHGIPAEAGTTGGNCNQVIVSLTDNDEVLVGDVDGPCASTDEEITSWWVGLYLLDQEPIDLADGVHDADAVLAVLRDNCDDMFDLDHLAHLRALLDDQ
jgi:hypothetical protein